jgi:hypothetical protein
VKAIATAIATLLLLGLVAAGCGAGGDTPIAEQDCSQLLATSHKTNVTVLHGGHSDTAEEYAIQDRATELGEGCWHRIENASTAFFQADGPGSKHQGNECDEVIDETRQLDHQTDADPTNEALYDGYTDLEQRAIDIGPACDARWGAR